MSGVKQQVEELLEKSADFFKRQEALREKDLFIKEKRANTEYESIMKSESNLAISQETDFSRVTQQELDRYIDNNTKYFNAAKNPLTFINQTFDNIVPLFRNNLILIGAETGSGKSTCVINCVLSAIRDCKKVLVLTNEQSVEDFYNMLTCLLKGWAYNNHSDFTVEQIGTMNQTMDFLGKSGKLTVVDDNYNGSSGATSTIEGIERVLDNLIKNNTHYDLILIDYYQNIVASQDNPRLNEYEVQRKFVQKMDKYKNVYPAPIVIVAQVKPQKEDENIPFKVRLEGTKLILNKATFAMEMVRDTENLRTEWKVIKSRFSGHYGKTITTGFDRGRFVEYTQEFRHNALKMKEEREYKRNLGESNEENK